MIRSGRFWMVVWCSLGVVTIAWGLLTVVFWLDSTKNLNLLSVFAAVVAVAGGIQATLAMRKADSDDDF